MKAVILPRSRRCVDCLFSLVALLILTPIIAAAFAFVSLFPHHGGKGIAIGLGFLLAFSVGFTVDAFKAWRRGECNARRSS